MTYLVSGMTVSETAEKLDLSDVLVVSVLASARRKLSAKTNLHAAARFALERNTNA